MSGSIILSSTRRLGPCLIVVLCLLLSWSAAEQVSSEAVTSSGAVLPTHEARANQDDHTVTYGISGREADALESTSQIASVSLAASSNVALDIGSMTTIEGMTAADVSPVITTDTIEFRVLVGLSCKWLDGNGVERRSRVCPLQSTCDLGPITIAKKSGLDQRLYFCTGEQHLLVSIACRLEDTDRVVVLPRCKAHSRCSIGPLALSYGGRPVRGYFCDAQMLPPSSSDWKNQGTAAETWTASGRSRLDRRQRQQEPRRSSNLPTFNGGKSEKDDNDSEDRDWMRDGRDHGKNHENDHNKDHGEDHGKDHDESDNDADHVHSGPHDGQGGHYPTIDSLEEVTITSETTPTAETSDGKRFPRTTA